MASKSEAKLEYTKPVLVNLSVRETANNKRRIRRRSEGSFTIGRGRGRPPWAGRRFTFYYSSTGSGNGSGRDS